MNFTIKLNANNQIHVYIYLYIVLMSFDIKLNFNLKINKALFFKIFSLKLTFCRKQKFSTKTLNLSLRYMCLGVSLIES